MIHECPVSFECRDPDLPIIFIRVKQRTALIAYQLLFLDIVADFTAAVQTL